MPTGFRRRRRRWDGAATLREARRADGSRRVCAQGSNCCVARLCGDAHDRVRGSGWSEHDGRRSRGRRQVGRSSREDGPGAPPSGLLGDAPCAGPENRRGVVSIRFGDQDTRAAREADGVRAGFFVGSEHARDSCRRQQRPGELRVRPRVEPANLDHCAVRSVPQGTIVRASKCPGQQNGMTRCSRPLP